MKSLVDGGLGVKRVESIDLSGDLAGNDLEDLLAELDEKTVKSIVDLLLDGTALLLSVVDSDVDQLGVLGLLGGSEDERGVGGSILRLVLANGYRKWLVRIANSSYHVTSYHDDHDGILYGQKSACVCAEAMRAVTRALNNRGEY